MWPVLRKNLRKRSSGCTAAFDDSHHRNFLIFTILFSNTYTTGKGFAKIDMSDARAKGNRKHLLWCGIAICRPSMVCRTLSPKGLLREFTNSQFPYVKGITSHIIGDITFTSYKTGNADRPVGAKTGIIAVKF